MTHFSLDKLLGLIEERTLALIELEFAGETLSVCEAESLPQHFRLKLARAQAELQDYYSAVLREQESITAKLDDETLSTTQRAAYQSEASESAVNIAMKLIGASRALLDANVQYIEAMAQLEKGKLIEMIDRALDGRAEGDRKDSIIAILVARTSQLIRTALDDQEKNFQEAIVEQVKSNRLNLNNNPAIVVPMMPVTEETAVDRNSKGLKRTSVAAS